MFGCGTGNPFFSTDTAGVLRAAEIGADMVLLAKNIDGIYTADPKKDPSAVKYDRLDYTTALEKRLKVMDSAAFALCMDNGIPLVSSMGAGAKYDATKVRIADVSKSFNCPLAYIVRKRLRYMGIKKGFKVVFSEELPDKESIVPCEDRNKKSQVGTISYIPAVFGCVCAQAVIQHLMESK